MVHQSRSEVRSQKEKKPDLEKQKRLVGQAVKTPASHAGNMGSIPIRVTKKKKVKKDKEKYCIEKRNVVQWK